MSIGTRRLTFMVTIQAISCHIKSPSLTFFLTGRLFVYLFIYSFVTTSRRHSIGSWASVGCLRDGDGA